MAYSLKDLAVLLKGRLMGDGDILIDHVSLPDSKSKNGIAVIINKALLNQAPEGVPLVTRDDWFPLERSGVAVSDARMAMAALLGLFEKKPQIQAGVHPTSWVHPSARVADSACIGPMCVLSRESSVGPGTVLRARVFLGEGVKVGRDSVIEPGAVIYAGVTLGDRVLVHGNAVLGADGFGHIPACGDRGTIKIPQIGGVVIGDDVEIGACSAVDRGTISDTVIGSGTKIDNHVQVGHNVMVGENCLLLSQAGLAGSSVLGERVIMAAKSGVSDHVTVGKGAIVAALSAATKDIRPGATVSGFPARDHRRTLKNEAMLGRLAELFDRVKKLERFCFPKD